MARRGRAPQGGVRALGFFGYGTVQRRDICHATVMLYYDDHSGGVDRIRQSRGAQTDDQGMYEMTPLRPGTYFVSASAEPWYAIHPNLQPAESESLRQAATVDRSLDVAYPVTFYGDVTDAESATRIFTDVHRLALTHRLTSYDAAYLELAMRRSVPLATLDDDLVRASRATGIALL